MVRSEDAAHSRAIPTRGRSSLPWFRSGRRDAGGDFATALPLLSVLGLFAEYSLGRRNLGPIISRNGQGQPGQTPSGPQYCQIRRQGTVPTRGRRIGPQYKKPLFHQGTI